MNFIKRLFWPIVLVLALFVGVHWNTIGPNVKTKLATVQQQIATRVLQTTASSSTDSSSASRSTPNEQRTNRATTKTDTKSATQASTTTNKQPQVADATPVESIVRGVNLSNTYYYHFAPKLPAAAKQVFLDAVSVYNQTGIVHLVAGKGRARANRVTFSLYHKEMPTGQQQIELGEGGPKIYQWTNIAGTTSDNQAMASLNGDYSHAFEDTVAIHELGHALGLDHSKYKSSVMYPISQGHTQLSAGDLAGLRKIYQN